MSATKLQKLIYAIDGCLLVDDINVIDEQCRAWQYGPVYPKIFKKISNSNIDNFAEDADISDIKNHEKFSVIQEVTTMILTTLGKHSAAQLSAWSHVKGSPWSQTKIHDPISKDLLKEYFSQFKKERNNE